MKKFSLFMFILIILAACGQSTPSNSSPTEETPAPIMPEEMPDDFNFSIQFGFERKNEINTYEGTVTKDLIEDGSAKAEISFTEDEMDSIYEKMKEVNVMETKHLVPEPVDGTMCHQEPHEDDEWKITWGDETINISVSGAYCDPTEDAEELFALRSHVFQIVKGKEAYKALPGARGGYD